MDQNGCTEHPWLATEYKWDGTQKLTFTLRDGVKWSDGKPFTADDVVFTYEMIKKNPALDLRGIGPVLDSITAQGNKVVMQFSSPAVLLFSKIAMLEIVPKHIWEKEKDPVTFTNSDAVGTGPYTVKTFNNRQMVLERDPDYWQADKVKVKELRFSKTQPGPDRPAAPRARRVRHERDVRAGHRQGLRRQGSGAQQVLVRARRRDQPLHEPRPRRPSTTSSSAARSAVRIDRQEIADKAQFGYVDTASQTGLILPNQKDWLDPEIADEGKIGFDEDKAKQALEDAGYKEQRRQAARQGRQAAAPSS